MTPNIQLRMMVYASLLAALTAAGAYLAIPIGPVPIVLQNLFILLAGLLLGSRWGLASVSVYLLTGALGLPVFAGGLGGIGRLVGPTGGYLVGFLPAVFVIGWITEKAKEHQSLVQENTFLREESKGPTEIIAVSPSMCKIFEEAVKVAKTNASVLIQGESGTGKEVIAGAIHAHSLRADRPYIRVNCAAIPDTLIESEFFGHEKGAFTGANAKRPGRFELADGGTLLLDEISEIPLLLQPKLLRVIQEREFERVGGHKPISVDVRLLATSNRNLQEAIAQKLFREDLYYRLNVVPIIIPPLRERREDIVPLAHFFLQKQCLENHKKPMTLTSDAEQKLAEYPWPGNIRELSNIIERLVVLDYGPTIEADHIVLEASSSTLRSCV